MTIAVVVVAEQGLTMTAQRWAQLGLVGDSLWIDSDSFTGVDPDRPNDLRVRVLRLDQQPVDSTLALQLSGLGPLDEARVVWVRQCGDEGGAALGELAAHLRELLPHDTTHWMDVLVPRTRTDADDAPLPGEWVQFRIDPSDRPAPDVTDAGWDLGLAVPLHVTLALAGILGGVSTDVPWARLGADHRHVVRAFSRLVDGGLEVQRRANHFLGSVLPATHAAQQHPGQFLPASPEEADRLIDRALAWSLAHSDGALSYSAQETSVLGGHPRVTLGAHLLQFLRFIPVGLMTLLRIRPEPNAVVAHVLEFDDLGYSIGPEVPVIAWTSGVPDFQELEARAAAEAAEALAQASLEDSAAPAIGVWEPLARLVTSLVDGGPVEPAGWDTRAATSHGIRVSIAPGRVIIGDPEDAKRSVPELASAANTRVARAAIDEARREQPPPLRAQADISGVTAYATRLARAAVAQDGALLDGQLSRLGSIPMPRTQASLLERLHGAVLGGLIRARLDAQRWEELATTPPPLAPPSWTLICARHRRWATAVCAVILLLMAVWWLWHDDIASVTGFDLPAGMGMLALGVLLGGCLILALYLLFRSWAAFMERGRRRLEVMVIWLDRALRARRRCAAQADRERQTRQWMNLLSRVPGQRASGDEVSPDFTVDSAPMSMGLGHPEFLPAQMDRWLADAAARPGWRLEALQGVAGRFSGLSADRALGWLASDPGFTGGRLDRLAADLERLQDGWRDAACRRVTPEIVGDLLRGTDTVLVDRDPSLPVLHVGLDAFLGELVPADDDRDEWPDDDTHSWIIESTASSGPSQVALRASPALCAARIRIQVMDPGPLWLPVENPVPDNARSTYR